MQHLRETLIQVADNQIAYLAQRSKELDQETRVTVYTFDDTVKCVIFDKDVLRLPSIRSHYRIGGMTALIDATLLSQQDLAWTAQMYGDHAFLTYVLTDGMNNVNNHRAGELACRLAELPDNWTVAAFVPDQTGMFEAKKFGFPKDNIAIWDTSTKGLGEAGETIRRVTDSYMVNRSTGIRGTRSLFSMGTDALNTQTVKDAHLNQLANGTFQLLDVKTGGYIREWVENRGMVYILGKAYYQLTKLETIQPGKQIAVVEKTTGKVFTGANARDMLGLPAMAVRVKPEDNPLFEVYVQSTSTNRKLLPGTKLLLLT